MIEAAFVGASQAIPLVLNIGGNLIAFLSLLAAINGFLGWFGGLLDYPQLSFEVCLAVPFLIICVIASLVEQARVEAIQRHWPALGWCVLFRPYSTRITIRSAIFSGKTSFHALQLIDKRSCLFLLDPNILSCVANSLLLTRQLMWNATMQKHWFQRQLSHRRKIRMLAVHCFQRSLLPINL